MKIQSDSDKKLQSALKSSGVIPSHIAIIMDGNGRWANERKLPRVAGHKKGVMTVKDIVKASAQLGIQYLTLYTFSTENWKRPKDEVTTLMRLLLSSLKKETNELDENNIKLNVIGNVSSLPTQVRKQLTEDIERTKNNTKMTLNLALSYSGRWEIIEAVKKISQMASKNKIKINEIDERLLAEFLTTKHIPDPDLLIRTSGEFRISNFLLWQIAYTEIYVCKEFWPDFKRESLYNAIRSFQMRERRYGKVSEQIEKNEKALHLSGLPDKKTDNSHIHKALQ